jgi:plasmid stability protein
MAQLVIRKLEEAVKARLRRRAQRHRRSMEEEAREILRSALQRDETPAAGLGSEIAALFRAVGLESDIRELRGHAGTPARFDQ